MSFVNDETHRREWSSQLTRPTRVAHRTRPRRQDSKSCPGYIHTLRTYRRERALSRMRPPCTCALSVSLYLYQSLGAAKGEGVLNRGLKRPTWVDRSDDVVACPLGEARDTLTNLFRVGAHIWSPGRPSIAFDGLVPMAASRARSSASGRFHDCSGAPGAEWHDSRGVSACPTSLWVARAHLRSSRLRPFRAVSSSRRVLSSALIYLSVALLVLS